MGTQQKNSTFHEELQNLMDEYVHAVYDYSKNFPVGERFGVTSQLRRSALSVVLNYVEGYARRQKNTLRHLLEVSYGSLKESRYLVGFSYKRDYLNEEQHNKLEQLAERIGAMLWGTISKL